MLKIVGGSFGLSGSVSINYKTGDFFVGGRSSSTYKIEDVAAVDLDQQSQSKTSILSVLVGLLVITPILTLLLNIIGFVLGLVLTFIGSKYTVKKHTATVSFRDGKTVRLQGSRGEIDRLASLQ